MSGGGNGPRDDVPGPQETCEDKYEVALDDWRNLYPGRDIMMKLPDPSPVHLEPDPKDKTIIVRDVQSGEKIGHVVHNRLRNCMDSHNYEGVFFRKDQSPWVRAFKK